MTGNLEKAHIGIDIGGTTVKLALVTSEGTILSRLRFPTSHDIPCDLLLKELADSVATLSNEAKKSGYCISGIGVGVPGLVTVTGEIASVVNLPALQGVDLATALSELTSFPVVVLNDANAAAYGEFILGAGRHYQSLIMLTLGTGIGGGMILDRMLWLGADGVAGEIGHFTLEPNGRECPCGNRGCLEQYASASAIAAEWSAVLCARGSASEAASAAAAAKAASDGDRDAQKIFADAGHYLGIALAAIANLLNIEAAVIGGGVAASFNLIESSIREEVKRRAFPIPANRLQILPAVLGDDAGILGAVSYARDILAVAGNLLK
jgi:glucokinase